MAAEPSPPSPGAGHPRGRLWFLAAAGLWYGAVLTLRMHKTLADHPDLFAARRLLPICARKSARARADSPGLIRPNRMRPFYFSAPFPGDELQAQLSIARVDRRVVASIGTGIPPGAKPCPQQVAAPGPVKPLPQQSEDHFFSLQWTTRNKGDEVEISGLVENRDGPTMRDVTLIVHAYDADGKTLKTQQAVLFGIFEKKEVRPFTLSLRPGKEPERITVGVERYQFDVKGF